MSIRLALAVLLLIAALVAVYVMLQAEPMSPLRIDPPPAAPPAVVEAPEPAPAIVAPRVAVDAAPVKKARGMIPELHPRPDGLQSVWGGVLDATTSQPLDFFVTFLAPVEAGDILKLTQTSEIRRLWSNSKGAFSYRSVQPGRYNLLVRREGYKDAVIRDFKVPREEGRFEIKLERGAWIEVTVIDDEILEGEGGIEVQIKPLKLDDPVLPMPKVLLQETDDYGKALFTGIPAGAWSVALVNRQLSGNPEQQIYVAPETGTPVQFVVLALNTVTVRVKANTGEALNECHVRMWSKSKLGTFRDSTDGDGEVIFTHVPAGTYMITLWKGGWFRKEKEVTLQTTGAEHEFEIAINPDPKADIGGSDAHPTKEELDRILAGERSNKVHTQKDDG